MRIRRNTPQGKQRGHGKPTYVQSEQIGHFTTQLSFVTIFDRKKEKMPFQCRQPICHSVYFRYRNTKTRLLISYHEQQEAGSGSES
jgi:hypothetical protein